jgi:hypothetical protein
MLVEISEWGKHFLHAWEAGLQYSAGSPYYPPTGYKKPA